MGGITWVSDCSVDTPVFDPGTGVTLHGFDGLYRSKTSSGSDQVGGMKSSGRARLPQHGKSVKILDPHPYTCTMIWHNMGIFQDVTIPPGAGFSITTLAPKPGQTHIAPDPAQEYKVISKLRERAYGSGFNPAVFAVELPEALSMISSSALRIRRGLLCAALGDWRGIVHNLSSPTGVSASHWDARVQQATIGYTQGRKTLSQLWLEIQYGWRPLISDIEDGSKYIVEALTTGPRNTVSAHRSYEQVDDLSLSSGQVYLTHRRTVTTIRYKIEKLVTSSVLLPSLATVATAAWEKLPYSFVCDWVVPVGAYLEALRSSADLHGTVVRTLHQSTIWTAPKGGNRNLIPRSLNAGRCSYRLMTLNRSVTSEISPPLPTRDLSPSGIISSLTRAANAVALLQNLSFREGDRLGINKLLQATR